MAPLEPAWVDDTCHATCRTGSLVVQSLQTVKCGFTCASVGGFTCASVGGFTCASVGGFTCASVGGFTCASVGGFTCASVGGLVGHCTEVLHTNQ